MKVSYCNKAKVYEKEFPAEFIANFNQNLFCMFCFNVVACKKRLTAERHLATTKHRRYIGILKEEKTGKDKGKLKKQTFFQPAIKNSFTEKLVKALLASDIPLYKFRTGILSNSADLG